MNADVAAFERVLRSDAGLEALPSRTWFAGKKLCVAWAGQFLGAPGDWRMVAAEANGQPAAVAYWHGEPLGVAVLTPAEDGIAHLTVFGDAALVARFVSPAGR